MFQRRMYFLVLPYCVRRKAVTAWLRPNGICTRRSVWPSTSQIRNRTAKVSPHHPPMQDRRQRKRGGSATCSNHRVSGLVQPLFVSSNVCLEQTVMDVNCSSIDSCLRILHGRFRPFSLSVFLSRTTTPCPNPASGQSTPRLMAGWPPRRLRPGRACRGATR